MYLLAVTIKVKLQVHVTPFNQQFILNLSFLLVKYLNCFSLGGHRVLVTAPIGAKPVVIFCTCSQANVCVATTGPFAATAVERSFSGRTSGRNKLTSNAPEVRAIISFCCQ